MARVTPVLDQFLDRARTLALWLRMQSCQVLLVLVGRAVMPKSAGEACQQSWSAASPERAIASKRVLPRALGSPLRAGAWLALWEGGTRTVDQALIVRAAPFAGAVGECSYV